MIVDTVVNKGLEQTESLDTKRYQVISQQSGPICKDNKLLVTENNFAEISGGKKCKKSQETSQESLIQNIKETSEQKELVNKPVADPLEDSLWSPKNRTCDKRLSFKAKIPSFKVPGETKEYRINYMKWVLRGNKHIKSIEEEFQKGNSWVVVDFDCEYSRRTLSELIKKKEGDWCNLIPEEVKITEVKSKFYSKESIEETKPKYKERYRVALSSQKE